MSPFYPWMELSSHWFDEFWEIWDLELNLRQMPLQYLHQIKEGAERRILDHLLAVHGEQEGRELFDAFWFSDGYPDTEELESINRNWPRNYLLCRAIVIEKEQAEIAELCAAGGAA